MNKLIDRWWEACTTLGTRPTRVGAPRKFDSPEELWAACVQYFEWCESTPIYEDKVFAHEGSAFHEPCARKRAMTMGGLQMFLNVGGSTWSEWRIHPEYKDVVAMVDEAVRVQKFTGAMSGFFNATLTSRDLGLRDNAVTEVRQTTLDVTSMDLTKLSPEQIAQLESLLSSAAASEQH